MNYSESLSESLKEIDFFKIHPSYLPFVGTEYEKYKVLQISESHYSDNLDTNRYGIRYFSRWYDEQCCEVENGVLHNNITRRVCKGVIQGDNHFQNFDNPLRSFRKIVLGKGDHIDNNSRSDYNFFSFMNYYQFPAFKQKGYFSEAIIEQGKIENLRNEAQQLLDLSRKKSADIVDDVIDRLNPRLIVFTSFDASDSYKKSKGKHVDEERVVFVSHPNNPFPWSKSYKRLNGKKSVDILEEKLKEIYGK